jgi:hypothetical protein
LTATIIGSKVLSPYTFIGLSQGIGIEEGGNNMQTFWLVIISILLPIAGILELFSLKKQEPEKELPVTDTPPVVRKGKIKTQKS